MVMDRNELITKLQNLTKSGRRPRTNPGLVDGCLAAKDIWSHKTQTPAITKYVLKVYISVAKWRFRMPFLEKMALF